MTFYRSVTILCEVPNCHEEIDTRLDDYGAALKRVHRLGWRNVGGRDICPGCWMDGHR